MNILYKYVNLNQSNRLEKLTREQLRELYNEFPSINRSDAFLNLKNKRIYNKNKRLCSIKLKLSWPKLYATSTHTNFETAIKKAVSDLRIQLHKQKTQLKTD